MGGHRWRPRGWELGRNIVVWCMEVAGSAEFIAHEVPARMPLFGAPVKDGAAVQRLLLVRGLLEIDRKSTRLNSSHWE